MEEQDGAEPIRARKWCKKYERREFCQKCADVSNLLAARSCTIEVLAHTLGVSPAKVHYHLASLAMRGVVEKRNGKYVVAAPKKLDRTVLAAIAKGVSTLNALHSEPELREYAPEVIEQSVGKMELRRLIRGSQPMDVERPAVELPTEYRITYVGALQLGVCPRCGREVKEDGLYIQIRIAEVIWQVAGEGVPLASPLMNEKGVLFHSSCFKEEMNDELTNRDEGNNIREDHLCDMCGLPIDPKTLEEMLRNHIEVADVMPQLSLDEWRGLATLNRNYRRKIPDSAVRPLAYVAVLKMVEKNPRALYGLGDIELLLESANEGLAKHGQNRADKAQILARAKEIWATLSEILDRDREAKQRVVAKLCGPPSALLSNQELHWWTSMLGGGGAFKEEPENPAGQDGNTEGAVTGSSSGMVVMKGGRSFHPWCYRFLVKQDLHTSQHGQDSAQKRSEEVRRVQTRPSI